MKPALNTGIQIGDYVRKSHLEEDYGYLKGKIWQVTWTNGKFVHLESDEDKLHHIPVKMLQKLYIT